MKESNVIISKEVEGDMVSIYSEMVERWGVLGSLYIASISRELIIIGRTVRFWLYWCLGCFSDDRGVIVSGDPVKCMTLRSPSTEPGLARLHL